MADQPSLLTSLKSMLPESAWSWVIPALKNDHLVWEAISDPRFFELASEDILEPKDWSPGRLALIKLGSLEPELIDKETIEKALVTFDQYISLDSQTDQANKSFDLATHLALGLLHQKDGNSWHELAKKLSAEKVNQGIWLTPLAILFSWVDRKSELIRTLLSLNHSSVFIPLIIHAVICQPVPPEETQALLQGIVEEMSLLEAASILCYLNPFSPEIAMHLARSWLEIHQPPNIEMNIFNLGEELSQTSDTLLFAELYSLAGQMQQAEKFRSRSIEQLKCIQDEIINQLVGETLQENSIEQSLSLWTRSSSPPEMIPPASLIIKLLRSGRIEDSFTLLPESEGTTQTPLRWLNNMYLALDNEDIPQARTFGQQTLNSLVELFKDDPTSLEKSLGSQRDVLAVFSELILQLTNLALYKEAFEAAKLAARFQQNDPHILMNLSKTSQSTGEYETAVQAAELAVAINPTNPDFRRQLALSLELSGLWTSALKERKSILEHRFAESGTTTTWPTAEDLLSYANCSIKADQPQQAIDVCQMAIDSDPSNGYAHSILGEALSILGEDEQAMNHFTLATQLTPHEALPWLSLANAYHRSGDIDKSIETLRTATHAVSDDASIFYGLGKELIAGNSLSQAQSALERAYDLVSQPHIIHYQRKSNSQTQAELITRNREQLCEIAITYGDVLVQLGHLDQAILAYEGAYQAYPAYPGLAYIYAKSLLDIGDEESALAPLAVAVTAEPDDPLPYIQYAKSLILADQYPEKAVKSIQKALEILDEEKFKPDDKTQDMQELAIALLAQAQEASGELNAAMQTYSQALETKLAKDENLRTTLAIGMGRVALQTGQPEVAIAALQERNRHEIQNTEVAQILCEAYSAISLKQDALYAARTAVQLSPDDVDVLAWFAEQAIELGVIAEAVPALTSAAQLDPQRTDLIIQLGQIFARMEKTDQAREAFLSALSSPYVNPEDLYQAADGLSDLGDIDSAADCLERALEIQPRPPLSLIYELADSYVSVGKFELASKTIDKGLEQDSENAFLHTFKAELLGNLDHQEAAKACLEHALILEPNNSEVHFRIAQVLRNQDQLISAFNHAKEAVKDLNSGDIALAARGLAAELARSTIQEGYINQFLEPIEQLEDIPEPSEFNLPVQLSLFDYYCITSETALEREEQIAAATALNEAYALDQDHPRGLALQSRMALRQGDYNSAKQSLNAASEKIEVEEQYNSNSVPSPRSLLGIALAAIELHQWDLAIEVLDKAITISPNDSYLRLQIARSYVLRAEFQRLSQVLDIVNHAPGAVALSPRTYRIFDESIQETINSLSEDLRAEIPTPVQRWKIRGELVFHPSEEGFQNLENLLSEPSDQAALIYALTQSGDINSVSQIYHNIQSRADSETLHHSVYAAYALALSTAGENMISKEYASEAIQLAIEQNQTEAIYYVIEAKVNEAIGDGMASLNAIQTALSLWPDEPRWQVYAARISLLNEDYPAAINYFDSAIAMDPSHLQNYLDLSNAYLNKGDGEQAITTLKQAVKMLPEQSEAYLALASAQYEIRKYSQALKNTNIATKLAPNQSSPLLLSSKIALKMNDHGKAKTYAEVALRTNPNDPVALHLQAKSLSMSGEAEQSLKIINKAIPLTSEPLPLLLLKAELIGQFEGREAKLTELKSISVEFPDEPTVLAPLAEELAAAGHKSEATQAAQQALRRSASQLPLDEQANLHKLLGLLLRESGQLDQSIYQLSEAIRIAPNELDSYLELGLTQEERREHQQALETYQKAITNYPSDPRPYYQAGLLLKAGRDYPAAESMFRKAAEKAPDDIAVHRQLAALVALNLVHDRQPVPSDV
jgi:tetratricopeptide (TPR) repeat protein